MATVIDDPVRRLTANEAVQALYAAHWSPMVRLAWLLVRDQGLAEDVVQDALVALHRRWDHITDQSAAPGYLRRSVVNGARSVLRHRTVAETYVAREGRALHDATTASAESAALADLGNAQMLRALDSLPRRQREVLILRYFSDLSEADIAHALDISTGSVKAHAHRGLAALRQRLDRDGTYDRKNRP